MEWLLEHEGDPGVDEPMSEGELRSLARSRREVRNLLCQRRVLTHTAGGERPYQRGEKAERGRRKRSQGSRRP